VFHAKLTKINHLIQVDIKSIEEFSDLCCGGSYKLKHSTKPSNQIQTKGHKGFVIYISRFDQSGRECAVSKINFLDLAGLFFSCMHGNFIYHLA
jgi:kinesin family protein 22